MTDTRKWSALAVVLVAVVFAAGWFLLVSPKRSEASDLTSQTASQDSANLALQQKLQELKAQQADLPAQQAKLARLRENIPGNPALPSMIRDLTAASRKVGVSIDTMSPSVPVAVSAAPGAVAAPVTPGAQGGPALYQVPLSLQVSGNYFELEQFINQLEGLKRSLLVTGFSVTAAPSTDHSDGLALNLSGRVFVSQDAAPAAPAVTPVAPATSN